MKVLKVVTVAMTRHQRQQQQQVRQFQAGQGVLYGAPILLCLVLLMLACDAAARPFPSEYRYRSRLYVMERDREFYREQEDVFPDSYTVPESGGNVQDSSRDSCSELTSRSCGVMDHRMLEDYAPPSLANNPHPGGPLP